MGAFKECPRKYFYTIIQGYIPKGESVHLTFGLWYHAALERYDHGKAEGLNHDDAARAAIRYALRVSWNRTLGRPWLSEDPNKNRLTLVRSIVWYLEQFRDDPAETIILANGKPAVELSFRFSTSYHAPDGQPFMMCGHLDRVAAFVGEKYIFDRKTTKGQLNERFFAGFNPSNQISTYAFAGKIVYSIPISGVIIDGAQILVGSTRFHREPIARTDQQLEEWYQEWGMYISYATEMADAGYWPMNDKSCGNYGGCPFIPICGKDPSVRLRWLNDKSRFHRRIWDPLVARGDV